MRRLVSMLFLLFCGIFLAAPPVAAQFISKQSSLDTATHEIEGATRLRQLSDAELETLLAHLEKELSFIHSLKAEFVQERHLSIFTEPLEAKGILLFAAPDRVRFEITEPFQSILIAGPTSVAKYEFIDNKWKKLNLGSPDAILMVTKQIATWLQGRFRDENSIYEISAVESENTFIILRPKPEQLRKFIRTIELQLTPGKNRIEAVTIREPGENYTVIRFFHQERDIDVPKQLFNAESDTPTLVHVTQ